MAKLLADNPTLMRLRDLKILEKIASAGHLNIVLGEKGLAERVVNLYSVTCGLPLAHTTAPRSSRTSGEQLSPL